MTLDPFNTQRGGYFFGLNAHGVRFDGLYRNVSEYYSDWDSIWDAAAQRFDGGWTAEYEIPFKSLSFDPNSDTWGLNFSRSLETRNEDMAWVSRNRRWDPSSAGLMTGLSGLDQGIGLDVVPSASLTNRRVLRNDNPATPAVEPELDTSEDDFEPSLDLFYKLTPQMNAALTFNTDFSATEVDDRQVNLTRFGLFFPGEARLLPARGRHLRVRPHRRVGRHRQHQQRRAAERAAVLLAAHRPRRIRRARRSQLRRQVSGRAGRFELGALSIRQDENPLAGVDDTTLSVVRAKAGIGSESTVGAVFTDGDPLNPRDNSLAGFDALYRNSRLPGGRTIEAGAWYQSTRPSGFRTRRRTRSSPTAPTRRRASASRFRATTSSAAHSRRGASKRTSIRRSVSRAARTFTTTRARSRTRTGRRRATGSRCSSISTGSASKA